MSVKSSQKLKQLQTRKHKLEVDITQYEEESKEANRRLSVAQNKLTSLDAQIDSVSSKDIIVSEHAIIRYMERAMDLDLQYLKDIILDDATRTAINSMGNGKYPIEGGVRVVVKDRVIVSVT